MNYYYLIAGLPDIEIEDNKLSFSVVGFREEVRPQLSTGDALILDLFYTKYDNQNLLRYLKDKEVKFDERGNITKIQLEDFFRLLNEENKPKNKSIPSYFETFITEFRESPLSPTPIEPDSYLWENRLTELYYKWAMKNSNALIRHWFEFNMNLNNMLAAYASRKYEMNIEVLGVNEVADAIRTSKLRDFGLSGIFDDFETFQRLSDEDDLFEREKKIDLLKWQWLDEQTFFNYFSIEKVFAYLIKLEIIERWITLDPIEGGKLFRKLINSLKDDVVKKL